MICPVDTACRAAGPIHIFAAACRRLRPVTLALPIVCLGWSLASPIGANEGPDAWEASPHADTKSGSFTHWNAEGEIPADCAGCHSTPGFLDRIGADASARWSIDKAAPTGTTVECATCHAEELATIDAVPFPSGESLDGFGESSACALCHQGRASTLALDQAIDTAGADMDDDAVIEGLAFVNPHYAASAATLAGSDAKGGYEYAGRSYQARFAHPTPADTCSGCHDPHALSVRQETCAGCHGDTAVADIRSTADDIDGDGNAEEALDAELEAASDALLEAIGAYATGIAGVPLVHAPDAYPYFFTDGNGNGVLDDGEGVFPNRYATWTPRLLRATYNHSFVTKDGGAWAHNARYAAQLLIDSRADLASAVALPDLAQRRPR